MSQSLLQPEGKGTRCARKLETGGMKESEDGRLPRRVTLVPIHNISNALVNNLWRGAKRRAKDRKYSATQYAAVYGRRYAPHINPPTLPSGFQWIDVTE